MPSRNPRKIRQDSTQNEAQQFLAGLQNIAPSGDAVTPNVLKAALAKRASDSIQSELLRDHLTQKHIHRLVGKFPDSKELTTAQRLKLENTLYQHIVRHANGRFQVQLGRYFDDFDYLSKKYPKTPRDILHRQSIYKAFIVPRREANNLTDQYKEEFMTSRLDAFAQALVDYIQRQDRGFDTAITYQTAGGATLSGEDVHHIFLTALLKKTYNFTEKVLETYTLNKSKPEMMR